MMDVTSAIGAATIVTRQTSPQFNPQNGLANAAGDSQSVQQRVQNAANAANSENAASNDDAGGSDNDKDNAAAKASNGLGAHLNITA